jgi:hypothetical protein
MTSGCTLVPQIGSAAPRITTWFISAHSRIPQTRSLIAATAFSTRTETRLCLRATRNENGPTTLADEDRGDPIEAQAS